MKKTIFIILIISLILTFSACTNMHTDDINSHNFGEWVVIDPATCERDGFKTRYCECGARHEDIIPQTGHSFVDGTCENCGISEHSPD